MLKSILERGLISFQYPSEFAPEHIGGRDPYRLLDQMAGCLVGGVLGNALGATNHKPAKSGKKNSAPNPAKMKRTTADASLMLVTGEAVLRAMNRALDKGICSFAEVTCYSYRRLLNKQAEHWSSNGWVAVHPRLDPPAKNRATAIALKGPPGIKYGMDVRSKPNDENGSGGVVRCAPAGFLVDQSFETGSERCVRYARTS